MPLEVLQRRPGETPAQHLARLEALRRNEWLAAVAGAELAEAIRLARLAARPRLVGKPPPPDPAGAERMRRARRRPAGLTSARAAATRARQRGRGSRRKGEH